MSNTNKVLVQRDTFESNGKSFFSYFVAGTIRGKEVRAAVMPPDKGGYAVLDIVFGEAMAVELVIKPYEIKDEATSKVISGNTYAARSVDPNTGDVFETTIKPFRNSDKMLLNMLLR